MVECLPRIVPKHGGGGGPQGRCRYCVGNFTMDMYSTLLQNRQAMFEKLC